MNTRTRFMVSLVGFFCLASFVFGDDTKPVKGTVKAADGVAIAYDVRGRGDIALVFIHGWCGDREYWKHQLDEFATDYRVVAIDMAGHGESGRDRKEWSVMGLAGDVEAVVKKLGLKRVILIGHSMGGPVSLEAAKRMPGMVLGVVGCDTLQNADQKMPEDQAKALVSAFEKDFAATTTMGISGMFPEKGDKEMREWLIKKALKQDQKMAVGLFKDFSNVDGPALMKNAKVPVRCINSTPIVPFAAPTMPEINKKYCDYEAVMMEGVGHWPMGMRSDQVGTGGRAARSNRHPA